MVILISLGYFLIYCLYERINKILDVLIALIGVFIRFISKGDWFGCLGIF